MNCITEEDASNCLQKTAFWKEKLEELQRVIDRNCVYHEVAESARRIKKELAAEVTQAKLHWKRDESPILEFYASRIEDINFKFSAVVDAKPFAKLRSSISSTIYEIDCFECDIESWLVSSLRQVSNIAST